MSSVFFKRIKEFKLEYLRPDKKLLVFIFFLFLSSLFWLFNVLNKDYNERIRFPVSFVSPSTGTAIVAEWPDTLSLLVNSDGFRLINYYISPPSEPVILNPKKFPLHKTFSGNGDKYYILLSENIEDIRAQISSEIEVIKVIPDTVFVYVSELTVKKLPVRPDLDIEFEKQFAQKGYASVIPDSVEVSGPKIILDSMKCVYTEKLNYRGLSTSVDRKIHLKTHTGLNFSENEVVIRISVEKYTETSLEVPIQIINVPENFNVRLLPSTVKVVCTVLLSDYDKVKPELFNPVVDFLTIDKTDQKAKVRIEKYPSWLHTVNFSPNKVRFLIEKK
ncbi:MAG: hypothetical protein A2W91_19225 [Bacteroidetes bacterium GWF2_38_335]|nr:MAG: hypothetical protein A2W91_19225 [Bacteroidetes bacterium GWF2_38_335]OFY79892.1 MAG: hypothetical protein A2281_10625 [Bacteroidetes bacterium RIFOXYA12_FULL_38_20]HBS86347.1 hypothetical protein [Bacteroidales bacterium]